MLSIDNHYLLDALKYDVELNRTLKPDRKIIKSIMAASKNLFSLKKIKKEIYKKFSTANVREKEDIILALEDIGDGLAQPTNEKSILFSIKILELLNQKFYIEYVNFQQALKNEFYGDLKNRTYTKEELKSMSDKFKDLPKEIIQDNSSDKYSDKYL